MPWKREPLSRARKAAGFTQEELAERLGVDRSTVRRWEAGETEPQPWLRPKLARTLGLSRERLAELLTAADVGRPVSAPPSECLSYTLTHPGSTDLMTVAELRAAIHRLDERYVSEPSTALLADTGQYLGQVRFLSTHVNGGRIRRELAAAEAEAATLMSPTGLGRLPAARPRHGSPLSGSGHPGGSRLPRSGRRGLGAAAPNHRRAVRRTGRACQRRTGASDG
jgi:transcriptional regulator with XRE-family HTH domain